MVGPLGRASARAASVAPGHTNLILARQLLLLVPGRPSESPHSRPGGRESVEVTAWLCL